MAEARGYAWNDKISGLNAVLACQPCGGQKAWPVLKHPKRGRGMPNGQAQRGAEKTKRNVSNQGCQMNACSTSLIPVCPVKGTDAKYDLEYERQRQFRAERPCCSIPTSRALRPPYGDRIFNTKYADGPQAPSTRKNATCIGRVAGAAIEHHKCM